MDSNSSQHETPKTWGHRLKNENQKLKEKIAGLRKEKQSLEKKVKDSGKLLDEIPGSVALIQDAKVIFVNKALQEQLGYTEEELIGRNFLDFIDPDYVNYSRNISDRLFSGKPVPDQVKDYLVTKDGRSQSCEVRWKKIRYQGRQAFLLDIIVLDQREKIEKQLRQSQKIKAIARMASGLNRNFNQGQSLLNEHFTQLRKMGHVADRKLIRSLRRIEAAMEIGDAVSRQLDCLTKFEHLPSDITLFDPKKIVKDAVAITRPKWTASPDSGAEIKVKTYLRTLSPVEGNPAEIRDALVSMIFNAIDALPGGGEIYLTTEENSGYAWIYIQDNGVGMTNEIKEKIFDPFFTSAAGRRLGMGLTLAFAVVNRHGGEIEVISRKEQGATFIVKLPIAQKPSSPKSGRIKNRINGSRILMISDEGNVNNILSQMFSNKGGKLTRAYTGTECVKLLRKNRFDILIADPDMPHVNLSKIIPVIKELERTLPIVLISTGEDGKSNRSLEELGADLIIERPLIIDRISALISKTIEMRGQPE
ncbi:MAG: PAS domain S-box protein [Desulfobacterales bacterium]|nr:PAS domain S-box protein [Desulfobacterales bacterium]